MFSNSDEDTANWWQYFEERFNSDQTDFPTKNELENKNETDEKYNRLDRKCLLLPAYCLDANDDQELTILLWYSKYSSEMKYLYL